MEEWFRDLVKRMEFFYCLHNHLFTFAVAAYEAFGERNRIVW